MNRPKQHEVPIRQSAFIAAWLLACALLPGCVSQGERWLALAEQPPLAEIRERLVGQSAYGIAPDEDVLAMSPGLHAYINENLRRFGPQERLRRLGNLFTRKGELRLAYDQAQTLPASGVFATRRGNCLAFTLLFVAMARDLNLHARFREERIATSWTRVGEVLLINRHISVWGTLQGATYEADFGDFDNSSSALRQIVSDDRARAQYFNNLGAESIARGEPTRAIPFFNRAITIDPGLSYVWTNLGTALRALGAIDDAELAYRYALRLDATSLPALNGIARMEEQRGNLAASQALRELAKTMNGRNPYVHFALAQTSLAAGDYATALNELKTAIRLQPTDPDFRFELGRTYIALGKHGRALEQFYELERSITDPDQQRIYAIRLQELIARTQALQALRAEQATGS